MSDNVLVNGARDNSGLSGEASYKTQNMKVLVLATAAATLSVAGAVAAVPGYTAAAICDFRNAYEPDVVVANGTGWMVLDQETGAVLATGPPASEACGAGDLSSIACADVTGYGRPALVTLCSGGGGGSPFVHVSLPTSTSQSTRRTGARTTLAPAAYYAGGVALSAGRLFAPDGLTTNLSSLTAPFYRRPTSAPHVVLAVRDAAARALRVDVHAVNASGAMGPRVAGFDVPDEYGAPGDPVALAVGYVLGTPWQADVVVAPVNASGVPVVQVWSWNTTVDAFTRVPGMVSPLGAAGNASGGVGGVGVGALRLSVAGSTYAWGVVLAAPVTPPNSTAQPAAPALYARDFNATGWVALPPPPGATAAGAGAGWVPLGGGVLYPPPPQNTTTEEVDGSAAPAVLLAPAGDGGGGLPPLWLRAPRAADWAPLPPGNATAWTPLVDTAAGPIDVVLAQAAELNVYAYDRGYVPALNYSRAELLADFSAAPRNDTRGLSTVAYRNWYRPGSLGVDYSWGPKMARMPEPDGLAWRPADWWRARLVAVAELFLGTYYQHHSMQAWVPPNRPNAPSSTGVQWSLNWVREARHTPGTDCSSFTGAVFNLAMGLQLSTGITAQANQTAVTTAVGRNVTATVLPLGGLGYDAIVRPGFLRPGDLLYIQSGASITHVIMWVGGAYANESVGAPAGPGAPPLVIDSTGTFTTDARGLRIPNGVFLRPFLRGSWYAGSAKWATRWVADDWGADASPSPSPTPSGSASGTGSAAPTGTPSRTAAATATASGTAAATATQTGSGSAAATATASGSGSPPATGSGTPSASASPPPSGSGTPAGTGTPSVSGTGSPSVTAAATGTGTGSPTPPASASGSAAGSSTATTSGSGSPPPSLSAPATRSASASKTPPAAAATPTRSPSSSRSRTGTGSRTRSPASRSASPTRSRSPSATAPATRSRSPSRKPK